jgi:hypothetical protein
MATQNGVVAPKKSLVLNAFVEMCKLDATKRFAAYISVAGSGHQSPGLWRHPEDESWLFNDVDHWVELAKLLEKAKFHGIFIADVLGKFLSSYQLGSNASKVATMCTTHLWILQSYLVLNGPSTNLLP